MIRRLEAGHHGQASVAPTRDAESARDLSFIWPLLGRHIAFHRRLVDLTDSVKAALLLSQSLYWTRHGRHVQRDGGWFYKTAEQWTLETGLSLKEQSTARTVLRELAVLTEERRGLPARLYFRVELDELARRLVGVGEKSGDGRDHPDSRFVTELLGAPVAFHRALATVAGSVHAGLLLSRALHAMRYQLRRDQTAWVEGAMARWQSDLGLSRREQEAARRDLIALELWEERLAGIPPSLLVRVRLGRLLSLLSAKADSAQSPASNQRIPACGISTAFIDSTSQTRLRQPRSLGSPNPPALIAPKRREGSTETAGSLEERTTDRSLQPPLQPTNAHTSDRRLTVGVVGPDLLFPGGLLPAERDAMTRLLVQVPDAAQALLDELAGRLRTRGVRNAVAYLRALVRQANAGQFVPELAPRVAAERERRQREAEAQRLRALEEASSAADPPTPSMPTQAQRAQLRTLLADLRRQLSTVP